MVKLFKVMLFLLLVACQNHEIKVQAKENVFVYKQPDAASKRPDFIIKPGQVCFLGKEVYGKVDKFITVRCEGGVKGFVLDEESFEVIR